MFNPKKEFVSVGNLLVSVTITEQTNIYTGDIDAKVACQFNNRNYQNIGEFTVVLRGLHIKPIYRNTTGNGAELWKKHGKEILKEFQLID